MIEVMYRYQVHPTQVRAFEHAYGPAGPWVQLFRRHPGYRRTRLFRHRNDAGTYLCVDVWESKEDYDAFRSSAAEEYARLSRHFRLLYVEELFLGYYQGDEEYRAP